MGTRINRTYFTAPLFYLLVIFGLLFLQFAKRGEKFRDAFRELSLTGVTIPGGQKSEIQELHLRYRGVDFAFGPRYSAEIVPPAGDPVKLNLLGFRKNEKGFTLNFDGNVTMGFQLEPAGEVLSIQADFGGKAARQAKALVVRFAVVEGAKANSVERMPILAVQHREKDYFLSLPGNSTIDMARQRLVIAPEGGGITTLTFAPSSGGMKESFRQWYANLAGSTTADALARKVSEYVGGAYQGWKTGRYSPESGTWQTEKGAQAFKETALLAYLAESLRRGEHLQAFEEMTRAAGGAADSLTFASSAFLGSLQDFTEKLLRDDEREAARLLSQARNRDLSIWNRGDLLQFAADRGGAELLAEVQKFAAEANLQTPSVSAALGMLRNYYEPGNLDPALLGGLRRFSALINTRIFPGIIKIKEGFFLEIEPGKIDVLASLLAGRILILAGGVEKDPVLESIGRDMVLSSLGLSDKQGFLPRHILFADLALKGTEGRVAPEDVYPLVVDNPYYPRFVSLSRELGPGAWIYTAANMTGFSITEKENRFQFRYPEGATHHFVFRGARPYREIQIWGIPWRVDYRFERYATGSFFIEDKKLFLVKYQHKKTSEEFLMTFDQETE